MKRMAIIATLAIVLLTGCDIVVGTGPAEPADIPAVQFLRPVRDSVTGSWYAAWVNPENYAGPGTTE